MALLIRTLLVLILLPSLAWTQTPPDARQIIQKQRDTNKGFGDETSLGQMTLISPSGSQTMREFRYRLLEKTADQGAKSLIKILKPADLKGTGVLSHQNQGRDDDQWLYLPALKKTRRISGSSKTGRFIGSEFSYEDLAPTSIEDYRYTYVKNDNQNGQDCFVIEARPVAANSGYSKLVQWIRTSDYQTIQIYFYNKKGQHAKTAVFEDIRTINNRFFRPHKITMKNLINGRSTVFITKQTKLSQGLSASQFSKRALER